jgi:two-component system NtrC family response regulator
MAGNQDHVSDSQEMIGTCDAMLQIFKLIRKVAATDVPVMVTGASGTGKEMVARAIHQRSNRAQGPFVAVNCGAIPRELLESELFGHEKGSFTGAYRSVIGTVERAQGGTLFLDEVGELPLELQVKLLRFLQEYTFERVGGRKSIKVDLRVISATNRDLAELIEQNLFREDLYYRLDVIDISLPPLKDRGEDAIIMAKIFLKKHTAKLGREVRGFTSEALTAIQTHAWPGNIRELVNRIRRAVVMADGATITPDNLGLQLNTIKPEPFVNGLGLKEAKAKFEAEFLAAALQRYRGNVQLAAKALKTSRSVVYHLMQKYDIRLPSASRSTPKSAHPNSPAAAL